MGSLRLQGVRTPAQLQSEIAYHEDQLAQTKSRARAARHRARLARLRQALAECASPPARTLRTIDLLVLLESGPRRVGELAESLHTSANEVDSTLRGMKEVERVPPYLHDFAQQRWTMCRRVDNDPSAMGVDTRLGGRREELTSRAAPAPSPAHRAEAGNHVRHARADTTTKDGGPSWWVGISREEFRAILSRRQSARKTEL